MKQASGLRQTFFITLGLNRIIIHNTFLYYIYSYLDISKCRKLMRNVFSISHLQ